MNIIQKSIIKNKMDFGRNVLESNNDPKTFSIIYNFKLHDIIMCNIDGKWIRQRNKRTNVNLDSMLNINIHGLLRSHSHSRKPIVAIDFSFSSLCQI